MAGLGSIQEQVTKLTADVAAETTVDQSILTLVKGQAATIADLKKKLSDAIAANDPDQIQAVADALGQLHTEMVGNAQLLTDSVTANTTV